MAETRAPRASCVLLVFAAPDVCASASSATWARRQISSMWDAPPRPDVVVVGDGSGLSHLAWEEARSRGVPVCLYAGCGKMIRDGVPCGRWDAEESPLRGDPPVSWGAWYRHRDRVMTRHAMTRQRAGALVYVLVLATVRDGPEAAHRVAGERARAWGAQVRVLVLGAQR